MSLKTSTNDKSVVVAKFTVLLLKPDTVADTFGHDTWFSWVVAESVAGAIVIAQREASTVDGYDPDLIDLDMYYPLIVIKGWYKELSRRV